MKYLVTLKKALLAGMFVGIGCTTYLCVENKIVGAFLFGLGLFTIIILGLSLFTGKIGYLSKDTYKEIAVIYVGNFIGIRLIAFLMKQTRIGDTLVERATQLADVKMQDSYISLFILGIFCGVMMYNAFALYNKQPNILGTIAIFLCIAVFILCGFEHCIADMYYFGISKSIDTYIVRLLVITTGNAVGAIALRHLTKDL